MPTLSFPGNLEPLVSTVSLVPKKHPYLEQVEIKSAGRLFILVEQSLFLPRATLPYVFCHPIICNHSVEEADASQDVGIASKVLLPPQWQQARKGKGQERRCEIIERNLRRC